MDERVINWSRGRRVRIVVANTPGNYERLFKQVTTEASRTEDQNRLADAVACIFNDYVRIVQQERDGIEELVLRVGTS